MNIGVIKAVLRSREWLIIEAGKVHSKIKEVEEQLMRIRTVNYNEDKSNAQRESDPRLRLLDKKDRLTRHEKQVYDHLTFIKEFVELMEEKDQNLIIDVFFEKKTYIMLEKKYFYTDRHLKRIVNNTLQKYAKNFNMSLWTQKNVI